MRIAIFRVSFAVQSVATVAGLVLKRPDGTSYVWTYSAIASEAATNLAYSLVGACQANGFNAQIDPTSSAVVFLAVKTDKDADDLATFAVDTDNSAISALTRVLLLQTEREVDVVAVPSSESGVPWAPLMSGLAVGLALGSIKKGD